MRKYLLYGIPVVVVALLLAFFWPANNAKNNSFDPEEIVAEEEEQQEAEIKFGIPHKDYTVTADQIERNQNISDILLKYGVSYQRIINMTNKYRDVFDARNIRVNKPYTVFVPEDDTAGHARYLVYEESLVNYVVYDLDNDSIYRGAKEVYNKRQTAKGTIQSSLALTLQEIKASPMLTLFLSDIYAWSIDFYRLQKGDEFKVIYSENFVDGKSVGIDKIIACEFRHAGSPYYAFYFEQDSIGTYFDEEGGSLRKAFLKAPLKFSRISSRYSKKRFHPVLKVNKPHLGTDYAAPHGTPIMSTGDGVVEKKGYTRGNGNYVKIRHNSTYSTQYLHMSKFAGDIKVGSRVKQGQVIGYVGSTGLATGPHVCYRFWKNGVQVDPFKQQFPAAVPVKDSDTARYNQLVLKMMGELQALEQQAALQ